MIACRTHIGFDAPTKVDSAKSHRAPAGAGKLDVARAALGRSHGPFEIPASIRDAWMQAGARGAAERQGWDARLQAAAPATRDAFADHVQRRFPDGWRAALADHRAEPAGEAWEIARDRRGGPTALVASRQDLPVLRQQAGRDNASPSGGYVLQDAGRGPRRITLIATGSEVSVAVEARAQLESDGIRGAVVSMPSFELFAAMPEECRARVLGREDAPCTGIEATTRFGWAEIPGVRGRSVGMTGSGASDPAPDLFDHFGITPWAAADRARATLQDEG